MFDIPCYYTLGVGCKFTGTILLVIRNCYFLVSTVCMYVSPNKTFDTCFLLNGNIEY